MDIKQLLKDYIEDLKNNNLDPIFRACSTAKSVEELRILFLQQGIDPLEYVTSIPYRYFYDKELDTLDLSKYTNIEFIRPRAFDYSKINTLILPSTIKKLEIQAFSNIFMTKGNLDLPEGIKEIPEECFKYSGILELKIPESVLVIQSNAFYDADIDTLYLPSKLKEVSYSAFNGLKYDLVIYNGKECTANKIDEIFEVLKSNGVQIIK